MTAKMPRRKGKRVLHIIAGFLIASACLRIGIANGPALAQDMVEDPVMMPAPGDEQDADVLLAALQEREAALQTREAQMRERMQALQAAETEIEAKLTALIAAEETLSATIARADSASETDLAQLTAVYENMKPKEAAALFAEMSPEFAAGFLGLMRPEAAALIMTQLEPETAYSFSVVLAGRNADVPTQ